ncbi:hypothetical protein ACN9MF_23460 [Methylobacterium fujisawaense]|uniref:hypothetical protein n=1 Tax=Methylobacterium fujisawaense TaxID=107400 RepID=UPI003CF24321
MPMLIELVLIRAGVLNRLYFDTPNHICTPEDVQLCAEYRAPSCGSFQSKPAVCEHEISFTELPIGRIRLPIQQRHTGKSCFHSQERRRMLRPQHGGANTQPSERPEPP